MKMALASDWLKSTRHALSAVAAATSPEAGAALAAANVASARPARRGPRYEGQHPLARRSLRGLRPLLSPEALPPLDLSAPVNPFAAGSNAYPDPSLSELRASLLASLWAEAAHRTGTHHVCPLDTDNVLLTPGAVAGLELVLRAFGDPRLDTVCIVTPAPAHFAHFCQLGELHVREVPLLGHNLDQLDLHALNAAAPKIILISDPNNPVGSRIAAGDLRRLASQTDALVVVDESHVELADGPSALLGLIDTPNLVLLRSLSSAWGLAGARCGAVLAHPLIIHTLQHAQVPHPLSTPAIVEIDRRLADAAALVAAWARMRIERARLARALGALPAVSRVYSSQSGYLLAQLRDHAAALRRLQAAGIHVHDASPAMRDCLRIAIGTPEQSGALLDALAGS